MTASRRPGLEGFTLIEAAIVLSLTSALLALVAMYFVRGQSYAADTETYASVQRQASVVLRKITSDLAAGSLQHLDTEADGSAVWFLSSGPTADGQPYVEFREETGKIFWKKWVQLQLPVGKKATIYVTNSFTAEGENAVVNQTRLPTQLKIYYLGSQQVNLAGGSQSYLTLVAPQADLKLEGLNPDLPSAFYGALVGRSVSVINAALHFDVATEGVGTDTDGSPLSLLARHRL